jgi:hypothetical protein
MISITLKSEWPLWSGINMGFVGSLKSFTISLETWELTLDLVPFSVLPAWLGKNVGVESTDPKVDDTKFVSYKEIRLAAEWLNISENLAH